MNTHVLLINTRGIYLLENLDVSGKEYYYSSRCSGTFYQPGSNDTRHIFIFSNSCHLWLISLHLYYITSQPRNWAHFHLKMEVLCSLETLVPNYQTAVCINPRDHNINLHSPETSNLIQELYWFRKLSMASFLEHGDEHCSSITIGYENVQA